MEKLKRTQQWVQSVITHPDGVLQGATSTIIDNEHWPIDSIVSSSNNLTSEERINVYYVSYFLRLIECFKSEYKGLLNALGEEMFKHLAWIFLQVHPSTSYTLNELGRMFPSFLETTLNESMEGNKPESWQIFIIDMARYERLFTEVYNGEGHESIMSDDVFGLDSIKISPSVRTIQLQFPIADCIGKFRENEANDFPEYEPCNYLFSRNQYRVKTQLVGAEEWELLQNCLANPNETFPAKYRDKWLSSGIAFS